MVAKKTLSLKDLSLTIKVQNRNAYQNEECREPKIEQREANVKNDFRERIKRRRYHPKLKMFAASQYWAFHAWRRPERKICVEEKQGKKE